MAIIVMFFVLVDKILAVDFGQAGGTFPIKEEGFIAMIMRKLNALDLEEEKRKMQELARSRIESPVPVEGIVPAERSREFYWDPTYTLKEDAILPCGKVLYPAGTKVNPLDHMSLERRIYFIDGRSKEQIDWLKEQLTAGSDNGAGQGNGVLEIVENRIILVGGSVLKLEEELNHRIYFDQSGELTSRMGIKASPAIAWQEGKKIKIREVALNG